MNKSDDEKSVYIKLLNSYKNFRESYPKLIKSGFLAIIIIPIIFLLLMFSLDTKIVFLILWIVSIIICAIFIIIIEYTDYHYREILNIPSNKNSDEFLKEKISEMEKEENKHSFKEANKNEKGL